MTRGGPSFLAAEALRIRMPYQRPALLEVKTPQPPLPFPIVYPSLGHLLWKLETVGRWQDEVGDAMWA